MKKEVHQAMWVELMKDIADSACYRSNEQQRIAFTEVLNKMSEKQIKYMLEE